MDQGDLLKSAANILESRGKISGTCIHLRSGRVDLWGALCLAGGAKENTLSDDVARVGDYVPQAHIPAVMEAYGLIGEFVGEEATAWADKKDSETVVQLLRDLGYHVQFSVH